MRRLTVAAVVVLAPLLVGCDDKAPRSTAAPPTPSQSSTPSLDRVDTRIPADLSALPRIDVGLPRKMPTGQESMPSLLDDPPGRALMTYRPVESWDDPRGWDSETIYVLGTDGRWRRLAMADLGLAEEWWPGPDTYGAGDISPDGRWWASHVGPNVLLMDLRRGVHRLVPVPDENGAVLFVRWLPDSRTLQAFSTRSGGAPEVSSTYLVDVSGGVRVSPYGPQAVAFEPDGTAVRFGRDHRFRWATEDAVPTKDPVPRFWEAHRRSYTTHHGERLSAVPIFREPAGVDDLLVVDRDSLEPVARLVNRQGGYFGRGESLSGTYGWLDDDTLLTSTSSWLVTWTPTEGELCGVVRMPRVPPHVWAAWTASVALDLLRPRG